MKIKDIVKEWLIKNGHDGLCGDDCGCSLDDFAPCSDGPYPECESATARTLGPDEYKGNCGPGDIWFEPHNKAIHTDGEKPVGICPECLAPYDINGCDHSPLCTRRR